MVQSARLRLLVSALALLGLMAMCTILAGHLGIGLVHLGPAVSSNGGVGKPPIV
jgi:hypothetical protein